jgi:hypothetical protein
MDIRINGIDAIFEAGCRFGVNFHSLMADGTASLHFGYHSGEDSKRLQSFLSTLLKVKNCLWIIVMVIKTTGSLEILLCYGKKPLCSLGVLLMIHTSGHLHPQLADKQLVHQALLEIFIVGSALALEGEFAVNR